MNLLNRRGGRLHDVRVDVDVRVHLVLIQTDCSDLYHNRWLKVSMPHIRRSHDNNMQHLNCTSLLWRVLFTSFSPFRVLNSVSSWCLFFFFSPFSPWSILLLKKNHKTSFHSWYRRIFTNTSIRMGFTFPGGGVVVVVFFSRSLYSR